MEVRVLSSALFYSGILIANAAKLRHTQVQIGTGEFMPEKPKKKTVKLIRKNGVLFRIYETKRRTWLASYNFAGEKKKIHRASLEVLDEDIEELSKKLTGSHLGQVNMSALEWQEYLAARSILNPLKASIVDAARHYERSLGLVKKRVTVTLAVANFKEDKLQKGISDEYKKYMNTRLNWLTEDFGDKAITEVSYEDVKNWIRKRGTKGRAYNNLRGLLVTLWRWCQKEGYFPTNEVVPPAKLDTKDEFDEEATVFAPDQLKSLLDKLDDGSRAKDWVMLGAFFGLRVAEVLRLLASDIHLEHKVIEVKAARAGKRVAKTGQRRLVPIPDNLIEYVSSLKERKVKWGVDVQSHVREASQQIFGCWYKNVLRHSAISYNYALTGDMAQVASWAGTSPNKIEKNYRALKTVNDLPVTKELAVQWFNIPTSKNK